MQPTDIQLLNEMRQIITAFRSSGNDTGDLADRLLALRDLLELEDRDWAHQLTQHIATLDSGSTYVPATDEQARQLDAATATAIDGILKLIEDKLV